EIPSVVAQAGRPVDQIKSLIHAHLTTLLRFQQRNVTQLTELRSLSARHRTEVLALRDKYEQFSRSILNDAQAAGAIRSDVPVKYLNLELMSILNHASLWFRKGKALTEEDLADIFTKVFLEGAATSGVRARLTLPDLSAEEKRPAARARKTAIATDKPALARALDAAVGLFSRKGYAASSTREVAKLLGIQKATLYYHVESKEDLLFLICQSALTQIRNDVETATRDIADPLERVQTLIYTHIESLLRDEAQHSTTFTEMHALSDQRFGQIMKLRDDYENMVRSVLQGAQDAGVVRTDIEAKYLGLTLLGIMNRVMIWYRRGGPLSPHQLGRLLGVLFLAGARPAGATSQP
ncbi:MAG TPA: TetR family transcriptional regulator, partial [Burkholderiales bacterium]|nr:TetR family transcriptional regulator [Burkholderiales bacterium]